MIFLKEGPGLIGLFPQVVQNLPLSDLHARCEVLLDTVRDCLSLSTEAVLGSNCNVAKLAVGFACPCSEVDTSHLAVPSEAGYSLVWLARPQLPSRDGREVGSSNYCQFHTSARPMKSPATEITPPIILACGSVGVY